jgi:hypothetical protein
MIKPLADHIQAQTVQILLDRQKVEAAKGTMPWLPRGATEVLGQVTDMVCTCGGKLQAVKYVATDMLPPQPTHRKKRIRKKLAKRWIKETRHLRMLGVMIGALQPPKFKCVECARVNSYYAAMARNLVTVEPLPEGAMGGLHFDGGGQPE